MHLSIKTMVAKVITELSLFLELRIFDKPPSGPVSEKQNKFRLGLTSLITLATIVFSVFKNNSGLISRLFTK